MNVSPTVGEIVRLGDASYYVIVLVEFLYSCVNPFIYAANFDPVRDVLLRLIVWKRNTPAHGSIEMMT